MALYEFRCRECGSTFEVDRPMQRSAEPADCPGGHTDTVKLLSTVSLGGRARTATRPAMAPAPGGGVRCCGGGCCGG